MKFIIIVFIVFFSLAVTNSYSIITETYPSDRTITANSSFGVSGTLGSYHHVNTSEEGGFFRSVEADCNPSTDVCYEGVYGAHEVVITFYDCLVLPTGPFFCKKITLDSNGFHQTVSLEPCGQ